MTDTAKWDKKWFRELPPEMKCFWQYICDRCDHSGVWDVDVELASFYIGKELDEKEIRERFAEHFQEIDKGRKWFIPDFIEFQYGKLSRANRAHSSVMDLLERRGLKEKPRKARKEPFLKEFQEVWEIYPCKKGKKAAYGKFVARLREGIPFAMLEKCVRNYAEMCKRNGTEDKFIMHGATFFGPQERWKDYESIERKADGKFDKVQGQIVKV